MFIYEESNDLNRDGKIDINEYELMDEDDLDDLDDDLDDDYCGDFKTSPGFRKACEELGISPGNTMKERLAAYKAITEDTMRIIERLNKRKEERERKQD